MEQPVYCTHPEYLRDHLVDKLNFFTATAGTSRRHVNKCGQEENSF